MAFVTNQNFLQLWSTATTIEFLRGLTFARRLNGAYDGDAMRAEKVTIQNPNYRIVTRNSERKAEYGPATEPEAGTIEFRMNQRIDNAQDLWVEDEIENVIRDYRNRQEQAAMHALRQAHEENIVSYILGLDTGGDFGDPLKNNGAGSIRSLEFSAASTGFSADTGKPGGTAAQKTAAIEWIPDFFTDCRVLLERSDIPVKGGGTTIGGSSGQWWAAMPPELWAYGMAKFITDKGGDADYVTQALRDLAVFGTMSRLMNLGTQFVGHYRGFDLFTTNSLAKPADASGHWEIIAGSDQAIAGPLRPLRNYITEPQNNTAEKYTFRHFGTFGRQLVNSKLMIRGEFAALD